MHAFLALIDRLNACAGEERARLEAEIWGRFGVERALLALDMSRFSLSVRRSGILPYLALIRRMQSLTAPIVARHGGEVVKYVADNLMAVFGTPDAAVLAALDIQAQIRADGAPFAVAIGIDHGRFILVPGDCFGDTVNVACKVGEDVAAPGEILLTDAARAALLDPASLRLRPQTVSVSGLEIALHAVAGRTAG